MEREMYSAYIADGFADDCEELIYRCKRVQVLSYDTFCNIYKDMKFEGLYSGRTTGAELAELSEEVIHVAKHYMVADTRNFQESVAGLFLVYVLLNTQPYPKFAPLRLTPDDVSAIHWIQVRARRERRLDVLYILGDVLIKGPCELHASARERGLDSTLRKYFGRTATMNRYGLRPKGVFQRQSEELDKIRILRDVDRRYCENKAKVHGGSTDRNLNYWDKGFVSWLDTSLRKLVDGIADPGPTAHAHSDHLSAIKDRAMKVAVAPVGHLTGVKERAKKPPRKPPVNQFVIPRSPLKTKKKKTTSIVPVVKDEIDDDEFTMPMTLSTIIMSKDRPRVTKTHEVAVSGENSQDDGVIEVIPNIENESMDMMCIDGSGSEDEIRKVNYDKNVVRKDNTHKAKAVVYVTKDNSKGKKGKEKTNRKRKINNKNNKGTKNNGCQGKPSKKMKMSQKSSKLAQTKKKKALSSSDSDSESDIDITFDESEDELYSVTDDFENLTETIDDDIQLERLKESQNSSEIVSLEKSKNDTKCQRSRTRKSQTDNAESEIQTDLLTSVVTNKVRKIDEISKKLDNQPKSRKSRSRKNNKDILMNVNGGEEAIEKHLITKKPENIKQKGNRRPESEENVSTDMVHKGIPAKSRKSVDKIINENIVKGTPLLVKTFNGHQAIEIDTVDSMNDTEQNNQDTVDETRCLRTRQVKTTDSPGSSVNSPKNKQKSPNIKRSTEKSPHKKENRLTKQIVETQNSLKARPNLKIANDTTLSDEKKKARKKTSNENYNRNSPISPSYLEHERLTRTKVKEGNIETKLPDNVIIPNIDENKSNTMPLQGTSHTTSPVGKTLKIKSPGKSTSITMSPSKSTSKTMSRSSKIMSPGKSTSVTSPRRSPRGQNTTQFTLLKRKPRESKVKERVKSKLKRMGILPIVAQKEDDVQ